MEYYERIRAIREDRDMKQSEVAALLGTDLWIFEYFNEDSAEIHL